MLRGQHETPRREVIRGGDLHLYPGEDESILEELGVGILAFEAVGGALLELGQHIAVGRALGDPAGSSESRRAGKKFVTVQCHPYFASPSRSPMFAADGAWRTT